jgi:hypothetical protein
MKVRVQLNSKALTNNPTLQNHDIIRVQGHGRGGSTEEKKEGKKNFDSEMTDITKDLVGLMVYRNDLFSTLQSVNESISSQARAVPPPPARFFTPGIFVEARGYGMRFLKKTGTYNNLLEHDMPQIQRLFPDAKDARFGLMYGLIKGVFIYFASEKAAESARTICVQKTQVHDIHAFCYIRAPKERDRRRRTSFGAKRSDKSTLSLRHSKSPSAVKSRDSTGLV